ncbi:MAG: hypothetical protein HY329_19735 [Chloroflexi bacterium]|nr:hypothetical protein [Chloroflexota bacterium]
MSEQRNTYWCMVKVDFTEPSLEAEFNEWYNTVHLPELLEFPGFYKAYRLQVTDEGTPRGEPGQTYIDVYEIEHPAVFDQEHFKAKPAWDGKWEPYLKNWSRTYYRVLWPES